MKMSMLLRLLPAIVSAGEVVPLYATPGASMLDTFKAHGSWSEALGRVTNAVVVTHMDGCDFCEITIGTMLYNMGAEDIFARTGVVPYQLLVRPEGDPIAGHTYCLDDASCEAQASSVLGINVTTLKEFPTNYFYAKHGAVTPQAGDDQCGIAVRRDGDVHCNSTNISPCGGLGDNDMSNWICNLHTGEEVTNCTADTKEWKRCA